jgi:hypothetical protein
VIEEIPFFMKTTGTKLRARRTPQTGQGVWIGAIMVMLASMLALRADAQASPPPCKFLSAPGAVPAFCETFDQPAGTGNRSGDLNGTLWGVSRLIGGVNTGQGQYYDASPTTLEKCGQSLGVQPPNDVAICDGHVAEAVSDQHGVTSLAMYPKQPFDIAGRTGTVAFDVSDDSHGSHRAWPEFWFTDKPVPAPFTHFSSLQEVPKDGFGVRFAAFCPAFGDPGCGVRPHCPEYPISVSVISVDSAVVVNNYVPDESFTDVAPGPISVQMVGCVKASSGPGDMNHFELRISQNEIDVYGVDAGATGPLKKIAVISNMGLTLTRGLVWLEDVHYNGDKDGPDQGTHTFTWDNLAFDGPVLPRDLAFDVLDRLTPVGPNYPGLLNLGWQLVPNAPNPLTLMVSGIHDIDKASGAILTLTYSTDLPITLSYKVNSGVWHDEPWPFPQCFTQNGNVSCGTRTIALPVPLSEVQAGTNTIQFKTADTTNNAGVSNVDLILIGAGGIVCTVNCPTTTTLTSSKNPSNWSDAVTFTATVTGSGGTGVPSGTVTLSDGTTVLATMMLNGSGVAALTTSSLAVGNHTITATYSGDSRFTASTAPLNSNPQVVNQAPTLTAVTSSENPSNWGDAVTLTANVTSSNGLPSGVVTFSDASTPLGTGTLSGGVATFTTSSLAIGNHTITAQYAGTTNFAASAGPLNTNPQAVNQALTITTIATSANPSASGQAVTFTAAITAADQGLPVPTGTVTFFDSASSIGSAALDGTGHASVNISSLSVGSHTITASYGGDTNFQPSASPSLTQAVTTATGGATTTTLSVNGGSGKPVYFGYVKGEKQKANFVVNVAGGADGDSVLLLEGNKQIGPALTLSSGHASFAAQFAVGQHSVLAIYLGSNTAAGSTSSPQTFLRSPMPNPK